MYTTKEVVNDLNNALKTLSDPKKYWKKVKDVNKIPQFELKDGKLALSEESLEQLNAFNWVNAKWKDVNLWDEIIKLYRVYWWGKECCYTELLELKIFINNDGVEIITCYQ